MFFIKIFGVKDKKTISTQQTVETHEEAFKLIKKHLDEAIDRGFVSEAAKDGAMLISGENTSYRIALIQTSDNVVLDEDTQSLYYTYDENFSVEIMTNTKTNELVVFCVDKNLPHLKFCVGRFSADKHTIEEAYHLSLQEIQAIANMKD